MRKIFNKFGKIKHRKALCAILVLIAVGVSTFFVLKAKGEKAEAATATVQETTVSSGNIGTTIVGTGSLATTDTSKIQVPKGLVIDEVKVDNGDKVSKDDVIATVTKASVADTLLSVRNSIESVEEEIDDLSSDADDSSTNEYLEKLVLESELEALEKSETELTELLSTLTITAISDGVISSLDIEDGSTVGSSSDSTSPSSDDSSSVTDISTSTNTAFSLLTADGSEDGSESRSSDTAITIASCSELNITAPVTGAIPQSNIAVKNGSTVNYTGTITWNTSEKTFAENIKYTATIVLTANEGYSFADTDNILVEIDGTYLVDWKVFGSGEGNRLRIVAVYSKTAASSGSGTADSGKSNNSGASSDAAGSDSTSTGSTPSGSASDSTASGSSLSGSSSSGSSASGSVSSGSTSSGSSSSSDSSSGSSSASADDLLASIGTVASSDEVKVCINVDELDILTVEVGQTASITMDAIENSTFEGTVDSISSEASSSGSSTKYTVEIVLERTEDMLLGMSASATININEVEDALLLPVSALQESNGSVFVYTTKDSDDNPGGEVEVETGVSDGTQVEIISGLSEGDTIYYLKSESTGSDSMFGGDMPDMSGVEMPDMSNREMPSGGAMPSGGSSERPDSGNGADQ